MNKKNLKENEFAGAPAGQSGTVNYQTSVGTFGSPAVSQNPGSFNKSTANIGDSPAKSSGSLDTDVNQLYSKKQVPTVDEVITGIDFELQRMSKKDKGLAKQLVIANLKKDPKFYSSLRMMNIDDNSLDESHKRPVNVKQIESIISELAEKKKSSKLMPEENPELSKVIRDMKTSRKK